MSKYQRIRDLREDKFLTQEAIAHALHITQRTYSRYETGDSNIPLEILVKITEYHNTSIDYLLNRTDLKNLTPHIKEGCPIEKLQAVGSHHRATVWFTAVSTVIVHQLVCIG